MIACSSRRALAELDGPQQQIARETLYLQPIRPLVLMYAIWLCLERFSLLKDFWKRILLCGEESLSRRMRALLHTVLGVYYALLLKDRDVEHIHVHHGYFSSWVAMVAARVLGVGFSMTLHGSDLLVHRAYLDTKLENCKFCITISEYNRDDLLRNYSAGSGKVFVHRLGVSASAALTQLPPRVVASMVVLAVGRLHKVKNHAFLIQACRVLKDTGVSVVCLIAGEGPERQALEKLIRKLDMEDSVQLLGHVPHPRLDAYYLTADVVVLTSQSEGIPLVLMEAMVRGKVVLAPAITGVPELVSDGVNGFLYECGSLDSFVNRIQTIHRLRSGLQPIRRAARETVLRDFNREKNLANFAETFITQTRGRDAYADTVLQQV